MLGDYIWHDSDANGLQDKGEEGINGAKVILESCEGKVIDSTTTKKAPQDQVPEQFSGAACAGMAKGDGTNDSRANPSSCETKGVELGADKRKDLNQDIGLTTPKQSGKGIIGDYVWLDANGDGMQGSNEQGVNGATATLYSCSGDKLAETTTGPAPSGKTPANSSGDGYYRFTGLSKGCYKVGFKLDNAKLSCQPNGFTQQGGLAAGNASVVEQRSGKMSDGIELTAKNSPMLNADAGVLCSGAAAASSDDGGLADTGFAAMWWVLGSVALLGGGGAALYFGHRKRQGLSQ